jgi:hypothetical protein
MNIWMVPPPTEEPFLTLTHWRVLHCSDGCRYLNGWCVERQEGRCSTSIVQFDRAEMVATTLSGRHYKLRGAPGSHPDASYTWDAYCRVNQLVVEADVSDEYATATPVVR